MIMEKLKQDLKQAMKDGNTEKKNVLRALLGDLNAIVKEKELAKKEAVVTDDEFISVVRRTVKQTKEALEEFKAGKREDLVAQNELQLNILEGYLPKQMSEDEVRDVIALKITELGLDTTNKGMLMKNLMPVFADQSDRGMINKVISSFVTK